MDHLRSRSPVKASPHHNPNQFISPQVTPVTKHLYYYLNGSSLLLDGLHELVDGSSDVWGMQCFCCVVSQMVSEHDLWECSETSLESNTAKTMHLNFTEVDLSASRKSAM